MCNARFVTFFLNLKHLNILLVFTNSFYYFDVFQAELLQTAQALSLVTAVPEEVIFCYII